MSFGGDLIIFAYLDIFIKLVIIHVIKLSMKIKKTAFPDGIFSFCGINRF